VRPSLAHAGLAYHRSRHFAKPETTMNALNRFELEDEIARMYGDKKSPLFSQADPRHQIYVDRLTELHRMLYGTGPAEKANLHTRSSSGPAEYRGATPISPEPGLGGRDVFAAINEAQAAKEKENAPYFVNGALGFQTFKVPGNADTPTSPK
jgi:hypothetical protein